MHHEQDDKDAEADDKCDITDLANAFPSLSHCHMPH